MRRLQFDYELDFLLFGISSHVRDYRVCGVLNKALKIDLTKVEDVKLESSTDDDERGFSHYIYEDDEMHLEYKVLSNRGDTSYLVPEQSGIDYFLSIGGAWTAVKKEEILYKLKQSNIILMACELDPKQLRSKQNLLFV